MYAFSISPDTDIVPLLAAVPVFETVAVILPGEPVTNPDACVVATAYVAVGGKVVTENASGAVGWGEPPCGVYDAAMPGANAPTLVFAVLSVVVI